MKKLTSGLIGTALLFLVFPLAVFAAGSATLDFGTTIITTEAGKTFDVSVNVNPNGESIDTVRAVVTFDPTLIQATSVSLTGAFNRNIPGNYFDNTTGTISWGGFTLETPVKTSGAFAKMTFVANKSGKTTLKISSDSHLISGGEEKGDATKFGSASVSVSDAKVAEPGLAVISVTSSSHPNEGDWYAKSTIQLGWTVEKGNSDVVKYATAFDESSDTDPSASTTQTSTTVKNVKDGVHYFHIKGIQKNGKSTMTVHRRVNVDTTRPNPFELTVSSDQILEGESLWLNFATTDETSGVVEHQVSLNESAFQTQVSPLEITDLKKGTYFVRVAALDRAGNTIYQGKSVRVYPVGTKIDRPQGYQQNTESKSVETQKQSQKTSPFSKQNLLITLVLVVLVASGIIYTTKRRKNNSST